MSAYPDLKSQVIVTEEKDQMYPQLPIQDKSDFPPAYSLEQPVPIAMPPPTLCAQCSNAVFVQTVVSFPS